MSLICGQRVKQVEVQTQHCFFWCFDKIPNISNLRDKRLILAHTSGDTVQRGRKGIDIANSCLYIRLFVYILMDRETEVKKC